MKDQKMHWMNARTMMMTLAAILATGSIWLCSDLAAAPKGKKLRAKPAPQAATADAIKAAIEALEHKFGDKYDGEGFLKKLAAATTPEALAAVQRAALVTANPYFAGKEILYVVRKQYRSDHHNTATLFMKTEINVNSFVGGGSMKAFDIATGKTRMLVDSPTGVVRDPDVSYDGKKVLFSWRKSKADEYHIYEMSSDGSGVKALTTHPEVADIDPIYMPDGDIVFTSTREPKYCMCNVHIMANLYRMKPDGANIHQIGRSTLFEGHPAVLPDGRIIYDRWEYVDRNFGDAQGLWVVNPDGTNHAIYYGNNTPSPGGVIDPRPIPGSKKIVAIFGSCHDRPWGALAIIDRTKGVDGKAPVVRTWPASAKDLVRDAGKVNSAWDTFKKVKPRYEDPMPLDENFILVSRQVTPGRGEVMGLFLVDTFGNEILIHTEGAGCYDPMLIAARPKGHPLALHRDYNGKNGRFYVMDVHEGTHMEGVKPGDVKFLRVCETPAKLAWTITKWGGQGVHRPAMNWHDFSSKRVLGTVPIEADGSAHFEVPHDRFVFFQLLDENRQLVQTMRSGVIVQSGELLGCVGCHEDRIESSTRGRAMPIALKKKAVKLQSPDGPVMNYLKHVQPVFDRNCVKCHDFGKPGAKRVILAGDMTPVFNASYISMWSQWKSKSPIIRPIGAGPAQILQPRTWGSNGSLLTKVYTNRHPTHAKLKVSEADQHMLSMWQDLNSPYYPDYLSAYPDNRGGRCPLDNKQLDQLSKLTGVKLQSGAYWANGRKVGPVVSFSRPEISPCLASLKKGTEKYNQALAIIKAGAATLKKTPRADMAGFVPCEDNQRRMDKYNRLMKQERASRDALRDGTKVYDPGLGPDAKKE